MFDFIRLSTLILNSNQLKEVMLDDLRDGKYSFVALYIVFTTNFMIAIILKFCYSITAGEFTALRNLSLRRNLIDSVSCCKVYPVKIEKFHEFFPSGKPSTVWPTYPLWKV